MVPYCNQKDNKKKQYLGFIRIIYFPSEGTTYITILSDIPSHLNGFEYHLGHKILSPSLKHISSFLIQWYDKLVAKWRLVCDSHIFKNLFRQS